jgi:hypothetical protein
MYGGRFEEEIASSQNPINPVESSRDDCMAYYSNISFTAYLV